MTAIKAQDTGTAPVLVDSLASTGNPRAQVMKLDAGARESSPGANDGASVPIVAGQQLMAASLPVAIASNQTPIQVTPSGLPWSVIEANSSTVISIVSNGGTSFMNSGLDGCSTVGIQVTSLGTGGTLVVEVSANGGTNYTAVSVLNAGTGALVSSISATGLYQVDMGGFNAVRVRATALTSGTIAGQMVASIANSLVALDAPLPAGTNAIGQVTAVGAAASGSAKSGAPVQIGAVFNTTQPTVTNGQVVEAQATNRGARIVATGVDVFNVTVNQPLPTGSNNIGSVNAVGAAASGSAKSGNPVQVGAVFNTTQPTVTAGQVVEAQATNRGARIVATGVDVFNVTVNAPLPNGSNNIGSVNAVGAAASGAAKSGNPVQIGAVFNTTQPTVASGQVVEAQATNRGARIVATGVDVFNVTVNQPLPSGLNTIGGIIPVPNTSGGLTPQKIISTASTNATSVKAFGGQVYAIYLANMADAPCYLKLYNKNGSPNVGTDTPFMTFAIPGSSTNGNGFVLETAGMGIPMGSGISFALTANAADTDNAPVAANQVVGVILYK